MEIKNVYIVHGKSKKDANKDYYALVHKDSGAYLAFGINNISQILDIKPSDVKKLAEERSK